MASKYLIVILVVFLSGCAQFAEIGLYKPSYEDVQKKVDVLYEQELDQLASIVNQYRIVRYSNYSIHQFIKALHADSAQRGIREIKYFNWSCQLILETGRHLPKDIYKKLYGGFPKKPYYIFVDQCAESLQESPGQVTEYVSYVEGAIQQFKIDKENDLRRAKLKAEKSRIEQAHPHYRVYADIQSKLKNIQSNVILCEERHYYKPSLIPYCLNQQSSAASLINASLKQLWDSEVGRKHINAVINELNIDLKISEINVSGITRQIDMVRAKSHYIRSLEKIFRINKFSVYGAMAVLH